MRRIMTGIVAVGLVSACGGLLKDEEKSKNKDQCSEPPPVLEDCGVGGKTTAGTKCGQKGEVPTGSTTGGSGTNSSPDETDSAASDSTLPINKSAALALFGLQESDAGASVEPMPAPVTKPDRPFPVDECRLPGTGMEGNDPVGIDPIHNPGGCMSRNAPADDKTTGLRLQTEDRAEPSSGAAQPVSNVEPVGGRCASDAKLTKNVKTEGTDATLKLEWKVLEGVKVYQEAKEACAAVGTGWHLAEAEEMDRLFAIADFRTPAETNCVTSFWAAGARDQGAQCVANYRGFRYVPSGTGSPLPINSQMVLRAESGIDSVLQERSVMCVKGRLKPQVACQQAVAQFFAQRPLGVKDAATGLTWARITIANFSETDAVAKQCDQGSAQGWRIPTKSELEAAVKADLFKTAAYEGTDASCPVAWHRPEEGQATKVTCGRLAVEADGSVKFDTDAQCVAVQPMPGDPTSGAAAQPVPDEYFQKQPVPVNGTPYGLCVQGQKP